MLQPVTRITLQPNDDETPTHNFLCFSLQHGYHSNPTTPKLQHATSYASACNTDTTPTQPHRNSYIQLVMLQPATRIPLQPNHTKTPTHNFLCFSLQHGYHSNPTTPKLLHTTCYASACNTDTTPTQPHRNSKTQLVLQPATRIPLQPNHTKTPTHNLLCFSLQHGYHSNPTTPKLLHTTCYASACKTDTTPTQPHRNSYIQLVMLQPATRIPLQPNHTKTPRHNLLCFSLQHGYHSNPTTPKLQDTTCYASTCNTDTTPTQLHRNSSTHRTKNNTTNVVIQQNSRKLLMMDILMSETC